MIKFLLLSLCFILVSCATPSLEDVKNAYREDSLSIANNKTLKENYLSAREYVAVSFVNSQNVIQMDDKESGIIIVKGEMPCNLIATYLMLGGASSSLSFVMKITNKDKVIDVNLMDLAEARYSPPSQYGAGGTMNLPITEEDMKKEAKQCVSLLKSQLEFKLK